MTPLVLTSCRIFAGGVDLTGYSNKIELSAEVEEKDVTTFLPTSDPDVGWKKVKGGLASGMIKGGGNWEAGSASVVDDGIWGFLGTTIPHSVFPVDAEVSSLGYFARVLAKSYTFFDAVGEVAPWSLDEVSDWPVVRGQSLHPPGTARTSTGSGTAVQVGAVSSGQYMYAGLHVLSVSGTTPSLTVRLQSDTVGFPSPTTQITFTAANAVGGQISRVAGPITDDYWRADWTISGGSPSFLFVLVVGRSV